MAYQPNIISTYWEGIAGCDREKLYEHEIPSPNIQSSR